MCARSQRSFRELQAVGGGGERKFSKTFFPLKGLWRSSVRFSEERGSDQKTKGDARETDRQSLPLLFVSSHESREKRTRVCVFVPCVVLLPSLRGLAPSEAMRCE